MELPSGTLTFLFTDIEGSTRLARERAGEFPDLLQAHRAIVRGVIAGHGGVESGTEGDSFLVVFPRAGDAVAAAISIQRALGAHPWPEGAAIRVRIGMHTGEAVVADDGYVGLAVHHAARVCAAAHGGQILVTTTTAELAREALPARAELRDLGEFALKDLAGPQRLLQVAHPDLAQEFPRLRTLDWLPNNLPAQLTTFIGRDADLRALRDRLASERLVTLAGPGGVGKTRLALQVAAEEVGRHRDGVWLVELAAVRDPARVAAAVAGVLAVREEADRPLVDVLRAHAEGRAMLVVLDNCEQVREGAAAVAGALLAGPEVRVLATSREPLDLAGEGVYRVGPLAAPEGDGVDAALHSDAARLFDERARAASPNFRLTADNAEAIARICRRLDGLPLAIELAAARTAILGPAQLADRLERRLLQTGASNAAPERQRTLEHLIAWSFDLLEEREQQLFRNLSVFAGSFDLDAAERVAAGANIDPDAVLDGIAGLVHQSLIDVEDAAGRARYRYLSTIRAYAAERLVEVGEEGTARAALAAWAAELAAAEHERLRGADQGAALARLDQEADNLRAVLAWAVENDGTLAHRLFADTWRYFDIRSLLAEARAWTESVLATPCPDTLLRARALAGGAALMTQVRRPEAEALAREAIEVAEAAGDTRTRGAAQMSLGNALFNRGDLAAATAEYEQAAASFRDAGDRSSAAMTTGNLAIIAHERGDTAVARAYYEQAVEDFRATGDTRHLGLGLTNAATLESDEGNFDRARALLEEALEAFRSIGGDRRNEVMAVNNLGVLAERSGDVARAFAYYRDGLRVAVEIGADTMAASIAATIAGFVHARGDGRRAGWYLGVAAARMEHAGQEAQAAFEHARTAILDSDPVKRIAAERAVAEGRALGVREIEALLDEEVPGDYAGVSPDALPGVASADAVFRREGDTWEIAFEGTTVRLRDAKGLRYLAELLRSPGSEVHVSQLAAPAGEAEVAALLRGDGGTVLDAEAVAAYKRRMRDLEEELEEARAWNDPARAERARDEIEQLARQLGAGVGLGGRQRKVAEPVERMRKAVGNRIRDAIARIAEEHRGLGRHLENSVRLGVYCAYEPDRAVQWRT